MKKIIFSIITVTVASTAAFSQTNPLSSYLPHNTAMVMSFNPVKLANKVPGETFRQSSLYREMMKKDDGELRAFMSDPSISGIDFTQDLLLTTVTDTSSQYPGITVNIFGVLKNEALFALLMNKLSKGKDSLHIYGTNKMMLSDGGGPAIAWNNEVFVFSTGSTSGKKAEMMKIYSDTTDTRDLDTRLNEFTAKTKKRQRDNCFELLTPKFQNPFPANEYYAQVMNEPGDIRIWSSGSGFGTGIPKMPYLITGFLSKLQSLTGANKTNIINFENGRIVGHSRNYVSEEMAAVYKKYPVPAQQTGLVSRLPEGKLLALFMTGAQPSMAKEMMQKTGLNELLDSLKNSLPFDLNLLSGTFGNNAMLAVMNMPSQKKDTAEDGRRKMFDGLQVIVAVPIANKMKFEELKNVFGKMIDSLKTTEKGQKMMKGIQPAIKYNDSLLVFSLSEEVSTAFLANRGTGTVPDWVQQNIQYPMVMSLNMKEIMSLFLLGKKGSGSSNDQQAKKVIDMFDKILITGGNYENGSVQSKMEFRFSNANENAFLQLFNMLNTVADQQEMRSKAYNNTVPELSTTQEITITEIRQEGVKEPPPPPPPPRPKKVIKAPVKKTKG